MKPAPIHMPKPNPKSKPQIVTPTEEGHEESNLDEALAESFPASDPIAVSTEKAHSKVKPKSKTIRKRNAGIERKREGELKKV